MWYICTNVYMCKYEFVYACCAYTLGGAYIFVYTCVYAHGYYLYVYIYVHVLIHMCTHVYIFTHVHL